MKTHAGTKTTLSPSRAQAVPVANALAHQAQLRHVLFRAGVQPRLENGAVNDPLEREADAVTQHVMSTPKPSLPSPASESGVGGEDKHAQSAQSNLVEAKASAPAPTTTQASPQVKTNPSSLNSGGTTDQPKRSVGDKKIYTFKDWKVGLRKAVGNDEWHRWDGEIQKAVSEYNAHLSGAPGYKPLDWQIVKAIIWVETGANKPEWKNKPMQIGNKIDPGLTSLLSGKEGGDLILPPAFKQSLQTEALVRESPENNIRAGIGYLLMRMAKYKDKSILSSDPKVYEVTVKSGDSFSSIAEDHGTTIDVLEELNPEAKPKALRIGQVLKYKKASIQRVIVGWWDMNTYNIAIRYNSMKKDKNYDKKLEYALSLVRKREAVP